jgi:hypothetical protein
MLPARVNFYYLYFKSLFSIFGLEKAKRHIGDEALYYFLMNRDMKLRSIKREWV